MKLFYSPGACSLSPHIVAREAGHTFDLEQVDLAAKKLKKSGDDYLAINPKGQVPCLQTDEGKILTEGPAIVQYLADQKPAAKLAPAAGTFERYQLQEWLNFITTEIHKGFSPLFRPNTPADYKTIAKEGLAAKFAMLDKHLAKNPYLMGDTFTVADAYLFTVTNWNNFQKIDIGQWPNVKAFMDRMMARPKVQEALKAEGLTK